MVNEITDDRLRAITPEAIQRAGWWLNADFTARIGEPEAMRQVLDEMVASTYPRYGATPLAALVRLECLVCEDRIRHALLPTVLALGGAASDLAVSVGRVARNGPPTVGVPPEGIEGPPFAVYVAAVAPDVYGQPLRLGETVDNIPTMADVEGEGVRAFGRAVLVASAEQERDYAQSTMRRNAWRKAAEELNR